MPNCIRMVSVFEEFQSGAENLQSNHQNKNFNGKIEISTEAHENTEDTALDRAQSTEK